MKILLGEKARLDLIEGFQFYEKQSQGWGTYFLESLTADLDALRSSAGVHRKRHGYHCCRSKRFKALIFYLVKDETVQVSAVFDARRKPTWIRRRFRAR